MLRKVRRDVPADLAQRVCQALASGKLGAADLTARNLGRFLGQTTSLLYHHWGSLDGFLHDVSMKGFDVLADRLESLQRAGTPPAELAVAYVVFGLDHPVLYHLMFEQRFDWAALDAAGRINKPEHFRAWNALVKFCADAGSPDPLEDARLFHTGSHGIVSLAASGRMSIGSTETDRQVAMRVARRLVATVLGPHQQPRKARRRS